ncbi:Hint domain-containing protein [uncultured Boseongicola sp.]|uniref:Hint domain-containing protein n=1 Tax=uncultured Boseongicola sp. TaxID=1648499 RepID=UPI0026056BDD|nr:Hint domain-containing protein [uncultured Boseongicola sp.]
METLKVGDLIVSEDGAAKPVLFIGCQTFNAQSIRAFTQLCPVTIAKGTTATSTPLHDLHASPQHHIPVRAPELQTLCGFDAAFVAARDMPYARPGSATETTYVNLVCAPHTCIRANGCESETLFPGDTALLSMSLDDRRDIRAALDAGLTQKTAYPCLTAQEAAVCRSAIQSREKRAA